MVNIQLDLNRIRNRIVELYKSKNGLQTKQESIEKMIDSFKNQFSEAEINSDWRNDPATNSQKEMLNGLSVDFPKKITKFEANQLIKENRGKI